MKMTLTVFSSSTSCLTWCWSSLVPGRTTGGVWRLEGAGPQLGGEVLSAVLLAVALQYVEWLQVNRLQEEGDQTWLESGGLHRESEFG